MNVLVIGSGGREHAVAAKLAESRHRPKLFCAPGNGGIASVAECVPVKADDIEGMLALCRDKSIDYVVVTPDNPLAAGMVDRLEAEGIPAFGPRQNAAILESSKAFAKDFMKRHQIPTPRYEVFDSYPAAEAYIKTQQLPVVVKADGLALGKGVIIAQTTDQALDAARDMLSGASFGASGKRIVVEEFITGPEVSMLAFCDGKTLVPMVSAQDHKRAFDGDEGPNTGGMGAFSPSKHYTDEIAAVCEKLIFRPTLEGMAAEGRPFSGVLYFGLMLTESGPVLLEYNARFGDPETQAVLPRLKSDLLDIIMACSSGKLDSVEILWHEEAAACVVLASGGYPVKYETGFEISGLDSDFMDGVFVYHAGTRIEDGRIVTGGGRVLNVCATGRDLDDALKNAYGAVDKISFTNMHYRRDIGKK